MSALHRQPWDNIGNEDEWNGFVQCREGGLFSVPYPNEDDVANTFSKPAAIGMPMLAQLYPNSKPTDASVLYSYWYFGSITSIDKVTKCIGPSLCVEAYKKIGGVMEVKKNVPLPACRDYAKVILAFKQVGCSIKLTYIVLSIITAMHHFPFLSVLVLILSSKVFVFISQSSLHFIRKFFFPPLFPSFSFLIRHSLVLP